jgi:hypothetical protein
MVLEGEVARQKRVAARRDTPTLPLFGWKNRSTGGAMFTHAPFRRQRLRFNPRNIRDLQAPLLPISRGTAR